MLGEKNKREHLTAICHASSFHCVPLVPSGAKCTNLIPIVAREVVTLAWLQVVHRLRGAGKKTTG